MPVRVQVKDLKVGMFVVDVGLSWLDHPYLFCQEGPIDASTDIAAIADDGFTEAFVDPERSQGDLSSLQYVIDENIPNQTAQVEPTKPIIQDASLLDQVVALTEEHTFARKIYRDSLNYARTFMMEAQQTGKVDIRQGEELVSDIVNSMMRNTDGLLGLGKLRSHDEYTFTHCINVTIISVGFAKYCRMSEKAMTAIGLAALFHDVGKALVPRSILNKPGKLSNAELTVMREHPLKSLSLLSKNPSISKIVLRAVVEHHEKVNGCGYPYGLRSSQIHAYSKIIALADVYDALTSRRVYKSSMPANQALKIMYELRDNDFNTSDVALFVKFLGIYPVGTLVRLSNGNHAVVCEANHGDTRWPVVIVAFDQQMRTVPKERLDLAKQDITSNPISIVDSIDPRKCGVDPFAVLTN
ncbi:HD-GYP domain-containing protein [Desulfovibrio inopinatus]|uniref:HD-GYP domain-containing protein n=1 Tax=Desulfovibrio inopinatus TaxID=102109 RepID=UPI00041E5CD0|nr:HD-GYP domain-containing protein [Desulfovibrio inopinatus]